MTAVGAQLLRSDWHPYYLSQVYPQSSLRIREARNPLWHCRHLTARLGSVISTGAVSLLAVRYWYEMVRQCRIEKKWIDFAEYGSVLAVILILSWWDLL